MSDVVNNMRKQYAPPKKKTLYATADCDMCLTEIAERFGEYKISILNKIILGVFAMGTENISDILKLGSVYEGMMSTGFSLPLTREANLRVSNVGSVENIYDPQSLIPKKS